MRWYKISFGAAEVPECLLAHAQQGLTFRSIAAIIIRLKPSVKRKPHSLFPPLQCCPGVLNSFARFDRAEFKIFERDGSDRFPLRPQLLGQNFRPG